MSNQRQKMREDAHFRVLRMPHQNPETSQRALARAVGISAGGVHHVVQGLIARGFVKSGNFTAAEDKRRYACLLIKNDIAAKADLTRHFLARKQAEFEALRAQIEACRSEAEESGDNRPLHKV